MKITIYTITDCEFSKQEKEYLNSHNLQYEERNLEQNKDWLTEMLAISNNFAGTPVTKIEKDDGQIVVLKGFTPEEFNELLNTPTTTSGQKAEQPQVNVEANVQPQPTVPTPQPQTPQVAQQPTTVPSLDQFVDESNETHDLTPQQPPMQQPQQSMSQPAPQVPQQPTQQIPPQDDPMSSILNNLRQKSGADMPSAQPANMPNIPNPDFSQMN